MITYRAALDVPVELLRFVTRLLILERRRRCTPAGSRALTCREQAVMVLWRFRDRARAGQLGRDHQRKRMLSSGPVRFRAGLGGACDRGFCCGWGPAGWWNWARAW
jgi:hypothetical protein